MKYFTPIFLVVSCFSLGLPQPIIVDCPPAMIHFDYEFGDYSVYLGDESHLEVVYSPGWISVDFNMDFTDWSTDIVLYGLPRDVDQGEHLVTIGWYEWDFAAEQDVLFQTYEFLIQVQPPCCNDPVSCNYTAEECDPALLLCLETVFCFVDPCLMAVCEAYPDADCIASYCGGCFADFYMDNEPVDCFLYGCTDPDATNYNPWATVEDYSCYYCLAGDLDNNLDVDVLDVVQLILLILSPDQPSEVELCRGDMNGDGNLNVLDVVIVVNTIIGIGN